MSNYEIVQVLANDIYYISLCFSALLGLSAGLFFWWRVLR